MFDPGSYAFIHNVLNQWFIDHRQHFFRNCFCCRQHTGSQARHGNHSLQSLLHVFYPQSNNYNVAEPPCLRELRSTERRWFRHATALGFQLPIHCY
ncbi:hypothetical protein [Serratia plymuthica]